MFVAEQRLGVRVGEHDLPVTARGHGRVGETLEHGAQRGLAPPQPILQALQLRGRRRSHTDRGQEERLQRARIIVSSGSHCPGSAASLRTFPRPGQWGVDPIAMDRSSSNFRPPVGRKRVRAVRGCDA